MAAFILPMLPTLVAEPPEGMWTHEIKHDGYRTQLHIERAGSRAFTRNGHDWSAKYRLLLDAAEGLPCSSAILDGEVIIQDENGRSDFDGLKAAIDRTPERLVFYAFDLLSLDGRHLLTQRLEDRRSMLEDLIGLPDPAYPIHYSSHIEGDGPAFFKMVTDLNLEGIVSKKLRSHYRSGRTRSWLKVKAFTEGEFIVIGHESGGGGPPAALLARETSKGLEYAGSAFVTLSGANRDAFWRAMERLSALNSEVPLDRKGQWVRPGLRVKARHLRGGDKLRHATLTDLV